jgi:hypothetical protein
MDRVVRYTIKKLPHAGMFVGPYLFFRADREQLSIEEHCNPVGDAESALEFMGDNQRRDLKRLLKK